MNISRVEDPLRLVSSFTYRRHATKEGTEQAGDETSSELLLTLRLKR
jgi:hypothetical protein